MPAWPALQPRLLAWGAAVLPAACPWLVKGRAPVLVRGSLGRCGGVGLGVGLVRRCGRF